MWLLTFAIVNHIKLREIPYVDKENVRVSWVKLNPSKIRLFIFHIAAL